MISEEDKLFEEVDKPMDSKIVSEDENTGIVNRESSWTGKIKGTGVFPSGIIKGHGNSTIFRNGISISNWQGTFTTEKGQEITFIGKDTSKGGRNYIIRTYFTNEEELKELDGLVCLLDGGYDSQSSSYICSGYKLM
jgi:hypothetical protein